MIKQLVICTACGCHVRIGDGVCAHCADDLSASGATRRPERRSIRLQRVLLATAMAGLGSTACGGHTLGENEGGVNGLEVVTKTNAATERDIWGACMQPDARVTTCYAQPPGCQCGPAGECAGGGVCNARECTSDQYLTSSGECLLQDGGVPVPPSHHSCYGSPPLLS